MTIAINPILANDQIAQAVAVVSAPQGTDRDAFFEDEELVIERVTRDLDAIFGKPAAPKPQPPKVSPATVVVKKKFVPSEHLTSRIGDLFPDLRSFAS